MKYLVLAILGLFAGCSCGCYPRAVVVSPIAPAVHRAKIIAEKALASSERAKAGMSSVKAQAKTLAETVRAANVEAERVKLLPGVSSEDPLWGYLADLGTLAPGNVDAVEILDAAVEAAYVDSTASKAALVELEPVATANDKADAEREAVIAKQAPDAAIGGWIQKLALGVMVIGGLAVVARLVGPVILRAIKPI